jgi:hypothetical protein
VVAVVVEIKVVVVELEVIEPLVTDLVHLEEQQYKDQPLQQDHFQ